jgi:ELWxxDGT repeat protein
LNGQTFFSSYEEGAMKVWRTDGTSAGTIMLQEMDQVAEIRTIGNAVYFAGRSHAGHLQIWKTNGTTAGTILLKEYGLDYQYWGQHLRFTDVNGTVYFTPGQGQLWKSDGTPSGTQMLKVFQDIDWIGYGGGRAIFRVRTVNNTTELWRSSGTTNSTAKLHNMHADATTTSVTHPRTTVNNVFYFAGDRGSYQHELWRSDGTTSGTYMVKELKPAEAPHLRYNIQNLFSYNDTLYIGAGIQQSNAILFKSDGTSSGTEQVGSLSGSRNHYFPYGNKVLVIAGNQGMDYVALYAIEGNNTYHIKTLELVQLSSRFFYTIVNNVAFFTYGESLWRTDGTECGTQPIVGTTEVYPLVSNGQDLVFGARHPDFGREPYRMSALNEPGNPCSSNETTSASLFGTATSPAASQFTYGPNPFTSDMTFRIKGNDGETGAIQVTSFIGEVIETIPNVAANTGYPLGAQWPKGIYVIKATVNGKSEMIRVVKK